MNVRKFLAGTCYWASVGALIGAIVLLGYQETRKKELEVELRPYVAAVDGKHGVSEQDCLDFTNRMGVKVSTAKCIFDSNTCDLYCYSIEQLGRALRSYKEEPRVR